MDTKFTIAAAAAIICFLVSFFGFVALTGRFYVDKEDAGGNKLVFMPFYIPSALGIVLLYFFSPDFSDFIHEIGFSNILVPLTCTGIIYVSSLSDRSAKYTLATILPACAVSAFFLPENALIFEGELPFWLDRAAIIAVWFLFSAMYYILDGIDGVQPVQTGTICTGIIILAVLGATPFLYGLFAAVILAATVAYAVFNWYPARLNMNQASSQALGFMLGWMLFANAAEGASSSSLILIMFFIIELAGAVIKKITLRDKFADLTTDTVYYQANVSGLSPHHICTFLIKLQIIFIILSAFQIYAPNAYSLPLLALVIGIWFLSKLKNWQTPNKTIRELNRDFMEDIRQNIEDLKNNIGKD